MEDYLRIGLLIVTAAILCLIIFEYRSRRRPLKLSDDKQYSDLFFLNHTDKDFSISEGEDVKQDNYSVPDMADTQINQGTEKNKSYPQPSDLLIVSVIAKPDQFFASYDLIQAISSAGLQFGDMNIFHYYAEMDSGAELLFSLASATEPGEFDMDNLGDFSCAGLTLFMNLRGMSDPEYGLEMMLTTAQQLADDLGGEMRAGTRNPWNEEIAQQYRTKAANYSNIFAE